MFSKSNRQASRLGITDSIEKETNGKDKGKKMDRGFKDRKNTKGLRAYKK